MASKRKVNLNDYELTTTLGTGKLLEDDRRRAIAEETAGGPMDLADRGFLGDLPVSRMHQMIAAIF